MARRARSARPRVDVEAAVAQEAHERQPEAARRVDGQARRRRDGAQHRDAGHGRLLHELEARAARDRARRSCASGVAPASSACRSSLSSALCRPTSSRTSDQLARRRVNRPVACRPPVRSNVRCAARRRSGSSPITAAAHDRALGERLGGHLDGVDRGLAADAAGRRHAEVALHELGLERPAQVHRDDVVGLLAELDVRAVPDLGELERRAQQALASAGSRPRARSRCRACAS